MAAEITLDELMAEYERLGNSAKDEGMTTRELAKAWGVSEQTVRDRLRLASENGWVRHSKKLMLQLDGKKFPTNCYRIILPAKTKKTKRRG